jgi:hypothetical protein
MGLLTDLTWKPGRGAEIPPRCAAWNQARTSVEVTLQNAARLGALAVAVETAIALVKRRKAA